MLFKKVLRDIKDNIGPFLSVFLLTFLAVYLSTGLASESTGLQSVVDTYYEDTNLPDYWIYGENFNENTLENLDDMDNVSDFDGQFIVNSIADLKDDPEITLHFIEGGDLSKFYLLEGKAFNKSDSGGVWLDKKFADSRNLTVGDKIEFDFNGITISKTIRGLGYSSEYVFSKSNTLSPDHYKYGFAYLSHDSLPDEIPIDYNTILINTDLNHSNLEKELNDSIGKDNYSAITPQNESFSVKMFQDELDQHMMFAFVFSIMFLIIAVLVLLATMTRLIKNQRTQIGILKSLGFSKNKITLHYTSYGLYMPLIGGILGLILGPLTIPYLIFPFFEITYTLPQWHSGFHIGFILLTILIILASVFVAFITVRKTANESPVSNLSPKSATINTNKFIESLSLFKKLSFNTRWNLRDINRNKLRAFVSIVGVIGCVLLTFSAFGMYDSVQDCKVWEFENINHYQTKLTLNDTISLDKANEIADEVNGTPIQESSIEIKANNIKKSGSISIYNQTDLISFTDNKMNPINISNDSIAISGKMAELLNVNIGDTISWHLSGENKWFNATIDDIYYDPINQGLYMSPETYESFDNLNFTPNSIISSQNIHKNYTEVTSNTNINDLVNSFNQSMEGLNIMVAIFVIFAIILSFVVLYNLGIMTYTETEQQLATLKVLGFKNTYLRKILILPNIWYAIIGFIIGLPISYYIFSLMMSTIGETYYYPRVIHPLNLIITFSLALVINILIGLAVSRKVKNIDMVESMKAKE